MDLISLAKNVKMLHHAVTSGEIAEMLSDSDLSAARDAFRKAKLAENPTAQTWSAINHLESAHAKLYAEHHGKTGWLTARDIS